MILFHVVLVPKNSVCILVRTLEIGSAFFSNEKKKKALTLCCNYFAMCPLTVYLFIVSGSMSCKALFALTLCIMYITDFVEVFVLTSNGNYHGC